MTSYRCRELLIPSQTHNRVLMTSEIIETCRAHDFTDVILVHEHRGVPDGLIISHLPFGPTTYFQLLNVVTRHDIKDKKAMGTMPQAYPHLILNNFTTKVGERATNILKHLFPPPKPETKCIITFANQSDYISFRHHIYEKQAGPKSVKLKEIGPRFELRLFQWCRSKIKLAEKLNKWYQSFGQEDSGKILDSRLW
ncbi:U3 small nucleolar ribonucleoprotein protein imp4-like [Humulus lupulus]|uniref:U3 small nucleolar ribonucleoprotein protein imp4-like n=1 Tax=Humulus lupulus TaxID=3486 RepID=UPI002B408BD5|nr:U3 small nucleolar ribonucleoprotein protein imp4-like [Humulus lupulus]